MRKVSPQYIEDLVNSIDEKNSENLKDYLEKFFEEYMDISFLENLTLTGSEHDKIEQAITHLIKVSTITSVTTIIQVLQEVGLLNINE